MGRRYGRSPRGERLDCAVPHGHWKTTTFLAGLSSSGFIAPLVTDGAMTGELFRSWAEQMLAPELRPGDLVVMDNLPSHKVKGVREAVEARGAELLYLPPLRTSTRSSRRSPSSRRCYARRPSERSTPCGTPSASSSAASPQPSAPTTSPTVVIRGQGESALALPCHVQSRR